MADLENQLVQLLRDFTGKLAATVRQHALDSADAALVQAGASRRSIEPSAKARTPRQPKRTPAERESFDAEAARQQVSSYLTANPGLRMDELAERLQLPTAGLKPLVKKLVVEGALRAEGNTRGRKYFAGGGSKSASKPTRKAKPTGRRSKKR